MTEPHRLITPPASVAVIIPSYNSGATLRHTLASLTTQSTKPGIRLELIVVDDGSTDGSAAELPDQLGKWLRIVRLEVNHGRATARNRGAAATDADVLIFIDADCGAVDDQCVAAHVDAILHGADVSFGNVETPGSAFWDLQQSMSQTARIRRFSDGEHWVFTTQNVAIKRSAFEQVGGFDSAFDRYGFEDRDLFIRLAEAGCTLRFTPASRVGHSSDLNLRSLIGKMREAGYCNAHIFRRRHPAVYRRMPFYRIDCHAHSGLLALDRLSWPIANLLSLLPEAWLEWTWVPLSWRSAAAQAAYGAAYMHGTALRRRELKKTVQGRSRGTTGQGNKL